MALVPIDRYRPPYGPEVQSMLDSFVNGLSGDYSLVKHLSSTDSRALVDNLLELACKCQNIRNIQLGRDILADMPKAWLFQYLESCACPIARGSDDWEFLRLLEVVELIDRDLCNRLADMGKQCSNPEIREASKDFQSGGQTG